MTEDPVDHAVTRVVFSHVVETCSLSKPDIDVYVIEFFHCLTYLTKKGQIYEDDPAGNANW